jgi:hypothetical protein
MAARSCNHSCSGKAISITYSVCVCVCVSVTVGIQHVGYMACAVLCHLWPVWLYNIFPHYLINGTVLGKKVTKHKIYVLVFSKTFVWNIFQSKKNWARHDHKCTWVFTWSTRYSCQILMKLEFSRLIFEKYWNTKFHVNPSSGGRVVPCERTDEQTWRS